MRALAIIGTLYFLFAGTAFAKSPVAGDKAPDFSVQTMDGKSASLADFKGKVVLVGMFHICAPCRNQAIELEKVRARLGSDKLAIIGINTSGDSKEAVSKYLNGFPSKINFPYYLDPNMTVHKAYKQRDMPTVLIIGQDGNLLARTPGVGADQLIPYLKKLL
jgi:cytochrome c biogenesis protein CcmG, thiol:disulfide interchange protein DsbE